VVSYCRLAKIAFYSLLLLWLLFTQLMVLCVLSFWTTPHCTWILCSVLCLVVSLVLLIPSGRDCCFTNSRNAHDPKVTLWFQVIAADVAAQQNRFIIRQMYPLGRQVAAASSSRTCVKTARKLPFSNPTSFVHNIEVFSTTSQKFNIVKIGTTIKSYRMTLPSLGLINDCSHEHCMSKT
jgi:hypothetical protein